MAATCMIYDQRLKGELQSLRRKGALCASSLGPPVNNTSSISRCCMRCRDELGRIINRGACCPSCGQRVCKSCRQYGNSPTQWLCTVCHKQMELKTTAGEWMNEFVDKKDGISATETVKRSIQRSWTFSDVSPSPWAFLRGSPEMRAYSSMPRHQDVEYYHRPAQPVFPVRSEGTKSTTTVDPDSDETSELQSERSCSIEEKPTEPAQTDTVDNVKEVVEPLTGTIFRKVTLKVDTKKLPPGVTPPRSRRRLLNPDLKQEELGGEASFNEKFLDSDDYKLVFLSSSESSSREELHSDDCSSTTSGGLLDWDYFECWGGQKKHMEGAESESAHRVFSSASPAPVQCIRVPVPFPFPVPVPVFLPFPVAVPTPPESEMTTSRSSSLPQSEVLPRDEVLSNNSTSPLVDREGSDGAGECDSVVLTVYKNLDTNDVPRPIGSPETILRLAEAKLKDFTEIGDDSSVSSISSDEDADNRVPSTRIYKLNHSSEESSGEFSLAATPPASSDSSDSSDDDDSISGKFSRTLVIQDSSGDEPDPSDVDPIAPNPETEGDKDLPETDKEPSRQVIPDIKVEKEDAAMENESNEEFGRKNTIDSIITFSPEEVYQIVREFLDEERKYYKEDVVSKPAKNVETEVDSVLPETRSNTSDEFSGTESMEMPLEDSLECGQEGGSKKAGGESGRYTSLVMITQEQGGPTRPEEDSKVTVVTGANTLSAVICLEEGLADDDSWVEDLDREENLTTTEESSEEESYQEREEDTRGYQRCAIDFTLHTIAEESCEESEVEANKPTELEKYFFYGLGDNGGNNEDRGDTMSETSSIYSEGVESNVGNEEPSSEVDPAELASSRLEKYFLSGFMGFSRRDSDGSVGSDSEGRPSPEQRRKRLVRARGTGRQHSNSLDNLVESAEAEVQIEGCSGSSTETDSHDEQSNSFDKVDGQFDTVKRTKKKKRSVSSAQADLVDITESGSKEDLTDDGKVTPQPESQPSDLANSRNKQPSRDSGFVGSCDDLLKETSEPQKSSEEVTTPSNGKTIFSEVSHASPPSTVLMRKDSFNNWSSDEETNLMMSKMRAFFKTMVGNQPKGTSHDVKLKVKPPQLVYFESELTRLMKTVPGLKDEQVKEIVEYLSSEDTWSDSYDSSDYTSSDLENSNKRSALQEEISASCRQIISNFETSNEEFDLPEAGKDSAMVYQRLVASFNKMEVPKKDSGNQNSPVLIEKVMQHIGSRLWALMHEVSGGEGSSPRIGRYHKRLSAKLSASTTEEEEDSVEDYSPLPRSKSHDPLLEENRQEASDNERFSWRGSFESALMASDSRTRLASGGESSVSASALALAAKRRSAGDLMFKSYSREQLDRVRSCGSIGGSVEDRIWSRGDKRRRSSVPDSPGGSAGDDDSDEDEPGTRATLPRSLQVSCTSATNSLPRLPTSPTSAATPIYKSHSVHQFSVKSARYRPPGYRSSPVAPPPRRDRRRNIPSCSNNGCDDLSICSEPVSSKGTDEEVDRLLSQRASLGARSDSLASVYSGAGEGRHGGVAVRGEVQFALQYNYKQSCLEIHVKQCKDLAPVDVKRNRSDPYVKVYLLPDKSKSGKRKTRVKKHTLNPIFDEVLRFQISLDELEHRTLWLSVWHSDMFGRNDFLGEVLMLLEKKVFDNPHPDTYQLQERSEPLEELNSKGELIVGLKYETPDSNNSSKKKPSKGCLYVLVKEAKNLPPVKTNGSSDPFCKSYLLPDKGRGSKQKAPVMRKTCNPVWNHTFVYNNVSLDELADRSLELTIWDHDRLASNEFLGGVRLNGGTGTHNEKNVDWMDSSGNEISLWQRMLEKPNFWVESCLPLRPSLDLRSNV
ncbi:uncharacterized protein LOC106665498 isoform X2 [Cimex lectularius]|uniref:C2 domain-containing protein n=1 Tax=Cimex lectularius TaxID=79782 RepID=A0A8I6RJB9_CIMLE|nr:uncharacterized protein LOC106665498 isoform X2 [Cimex lectularius]